MPLLPFLQAVRNVVVGIGVCGAVHGGSDRAPTLDEVVGDRHDLDPRKAVPAGDAEAQDGRVELAALQRAPDAIVGELQQERMGVVRPHGQHLPSTIQTASCRSGSASSAWVDAAPPAASRINPPIHHLQRCWRLP